VIRKSYDLVVVIVLAVAALVAIVAMDSSQAVRMLVAVPFFLVLPGYAIAAAAFLPGAIAGAGRIACSIGCSLAVVVLATFALTWTPWGITTTTITALVGAITLGSSLVALVHRRRQGDVQIGPSRARPNLRQGALFSAAVAIAACAVAVARTGAMEQPATPFTQLWMVPTGKAAVQIGICNMEPATTTYGLQLTIGSRVVQEWPATQLKPDGCREIAATLPVTDDFAGTVEAVLRRADQPGVVYRHVQLAYQGQKGK